MMQNKIKIEWGKSLAVILLMVVEVIAMTFVRKIQSQVVGSLLALGMSVLVFVVAVYLFKSLLAKDWPKYRQHIWRNLLISFGVMLILQLALPLVRQLMGAANSGQTMGGGSETFTLPLAALGILTSLTSIMGPVVEEIIARYVLFYQFKNRGVITWVMFVVSAVFFGLIHWSGFQGNVTAMIPYMLMGAILALVYYFTNNIWYTIIAHIFFDALDVISSVALFFLLLFK
ncbi:MAG: CPBP family intramembrane metalloprotease [Lactobacillus sp.]|jgi:membrane protease YdiL (CAAX protease family)|nr:CPBP family intramembrane metalloprotease [Lactobacillus sp.]